MKIKQVLTKQEREFVLRLRYKVCVDELGWEIKRHSYICHNSQVLSDPLDDTGLLLGAFLDNIAIGTSLVNYAREGDLEYYLKLYNVNQLTGGNNRDVSISTKFIIDPRYRRGPVAFKIILAMYQQALADKIKYNLLDCDPDMVDFFYRLGYSVHHTAIPHPDVGNNAVVMVLELENENILKARKSPLLKYLKKFSEGSNV